MAVRCVVLTQLCSILASLISLVSASAGCPAEFDDMCSCGYMPYEHSKRLTYVTNCTNSGFDNTMMLRKLPSQTEVLIFVGNEVKDLPLNIFGQDITYEKLHTIDFSNNHIQTIKGRTFHNVANVTKLLLNDNDLYIISKDHHPRMFSNFINLRELHLRNAFTEKVKSGDYLNNLAQIFENSSLNNLNVLNLESNEISSIYRGELCSLLALEELYLADNHLKDIHLNFSCLKHLRVLDVGNNLITRLSDQTLKNLEGKQVLKLNLTANPFRCDCRLVKTYEWLHTTLLSIVSRDNLFCYSGFPPNVGRSILSLFANDLRCVSSLGKLEFHSSASFFILTIGSVCLATFCIVLLYKRRAQVVPYIRRMLQSVTSKFHYVSLERRDTTMEV